MRRKLSRNDFQIRKRHEINYFETSVSFIVFGGKLNNYDFSLDNVLKQITKTSRSDACVLYYSVNNNLKFERFDSEHANWLVLDKIITSLIALQTQKCRFIIISGTLCKACQAGSFHYGHLNTYTY